MTAKPKTIERNGRELLRSIGIGDFAATGLIPYLFIAPATTDPKAFPTMTMVRHLQEVMQGLGAGVEPTGYVDPATARVLRKLSGPRWSSLSWSQNIRAVVTARAAGLELGAVTDAAMRPATMTIATSSPMGLFDLPDVPGGLITYGVGAYFLYRFFSKRKAS